MKREIKEHLDLVLAILIGQGIRILLERKGIIPEMNFFDILFASLLTAFLGNILIDWHDGYRLKRKIKKTVVTIAKLEGIDPKSIDYENDVKVFIGEDGTIEVEVTIEKPDAK